MSNDQISHEQLIAIENALDGIAILDPNGVYNYMNKAHAKLFGYESPKELLGKSWKMIYSEEHALKIEKEYFPELAEKGSWLGETIGLSKQGKPVLQYISLTKLPNNGLICVCRDHSRTIEASRLEYLMGNLGKSVLVEDEEHNIVMINQQMCDLFNLPLSPKEMIGLNCLDELAKAAPMFNNAELVIKGIYDKWEKREAVIGEEIQLVNGKILERDYIPVMIDGQFRGQLWSYTDVTQNRKLQQSLVDAKNRAVASEKAKSAFLSTISHEIRTPMNAILGLTEQLSTQIKDDQHRIWVSHIMDSANSLLEIINDVLDISKIEAGKMKIENDVLEIRKVFESVINILKPKAEEKGLVLVTHIQNVIEQKLIGDEVRIRQIFMNIISNAIKFTNSGHVKIQIALKEDIVDNQVLLITCEDTGIGISKEALEKVFDDFYQEYNTYNSRSTGTGLGLPITRTLLQMMGGKININSAKGSGTTVNMELPLSKVMPHHISREVDINLDTTILSGKKMLIVEDNKMNRFVLKMMLENLKIDVDEAENGVEALEMIDNNSYSLVLMDIQMPVMDGTTALLSIRNKYGKRIPVIALTASAFKSEVEKMLEIGFDDCFTKPIDQKTLSRRLSAFFNSESRNLNYHMSLVKTIDENIHAMADNNIEKVKDLYGYLFEEINHAIKAWETAFAEKDWNLAKKILHREKAMLNSIGVHSFNSLISQIEDEKTKRSDFEYQTLFDQLIKSFRNLYNQLMEENLPVKL